MPHSLDFTDNHQVPSSSAIVLPEPATESLAETDLEENQLDWSLATKEIIDTLPRVWSRGLIYLLVMFAAVVLPWLTLSKVDETGQARGRLEPKGKTIDLDTTVTGKVSNINVEEGQKVSKGQVLLELDTDLIEAEQQQIEQQLQGQRNRLDQLQLLKNQLVLALRTQRLQNQSQESEKRSQIDQAQQHMDSLSAAYRLHISEKEAQVAQAEQAIETSQANYRLALVRWEAQKEQIPRYKIVFDQGVVSETRYLEVVQAEKESKEALKKAESEIAHAQSFLQEQQRNYQTISHEAAAEIEQARLRLQEQQRSYQTMLHQHELALLKAEEQIKTVESDIISLNADIAKSESNLASLKLQLQQRIFQSPIDGTIFDLAASQPGEVVQPGDLVAQIAPQQTNLILRAYMPAPESGFIRVGMPVKLKFDAYPFQDYGIVNGELHWVSPDTEVRETPQGPVETFEIEVALDKSYLENSQEKIILTPGQTASAEVIVRQRRLIDFILDPFKKLQEGGLEL